VHKVTIEMGSALGYLQSQFSWESCFAHPKVVNSQEGRQAAYGSPGLVDNNMSFNSQPQQRNNNWTTPSTVVASNYISGMHDYSRKAFSSSPPSEWKSSSNVRNNSGPYTFLTINSQDVTLSLQSVAEEQILQLQGEI
jgi:hypothetical protein